MLMYKWILKSMFQCYRITFALALALMRYAINVYKDYHYLRALTVQDL